MNTNLLSDEELRAQLARRAGAGAHADEAERIVAALDRLPARTGVRFVAIPAAPSRPRAIAGTLVALAAVLALVFVALPVLRPQSGRLSGYPVARALTISELSQLLAAGSLEPNATIVVDATIDRSREYWRDPCPMDRYPMLGILTGLTPEACVMAADLPAIPAGTARLTGTFALRYIGQHELPTFLYLGQITAPANGHAFRVTDDWPLQGRTFLVDGWLGSLLRGPIPCPQPTVDPLTGSRPDCAYASWLSTGSTSDLSLDRWPSDAFSLVGNSRMVDATGVLELAGLPPYDAPQHGIYVVGSSTAACPGDPPTSSRGCGLWRVLGKVDEVTLMATPTVAPATPSRNGTWSPADRPLDPEELSALLDRGRIGDDAVFVMNATLSDAGTCSGVDGYVPIARIAGIGNDVCVVGITGHDPEPPLPSSGSGVFAFRYLGGRTLGFMGAVTPQGTNRLAFDAAGTWPDSGTIVATGWIVQFNGLSPTCAAVVSPPTPQPLDPLPRGCDYIYILTPSNVSGDEAYGQGMRQVLLPEYPFRVGDGPGTYLVRIDPVYGNRVLAALDPIDLTDRTPTATLGPSPTGSSRTFPTPTPVPPNSPIAPVPPALIGPGNTPLTHEQFAAAVQADPSGMDGRVAIVRGALDPGCHPILYPANARQPVCLATASTSADDVWAVRDNGNNLDVIAKISHPEASLTTTLKGAATATKSPGTYYLVDAWLNWTPSLECDTPPYAPDSLCGAGAATSYLSTTGGIGGQLYVGLGDYQRFGSLDLNTGPIHGVFLVKLGPMDGCGGAGPNPALCATAEIVARVEAG